MTKPERFKEEIGWLKALGALLFASATSLLIWLVQNYGTVTRVSLLFALFGLAAFAVSIAAIILRLYRCFKILEAS